ncbi:hypothetical protein PV416_14010 [Streptomyces ipomoeae]|jgi:hypothetical protein|uniref:hypothetical protein n=1 Tax=Streptomyces ipomoeae TaxID=103232 RepID=UPI0029A8018B|nr:hypothetical protein [Streptomyces ipomoeae]MDX2822183.1 hypothetical protein [Streptomyces ipomoeae]MDX2873778.1 hypothetical protein [Streptomyces ipomoeae]
MGQCPQCGGSAVPDPEHSGALWCLTCWHAWALPRERPCPGHLPTLGASLRKLDEYRDLRR